MWERFLIQYRDNRASLVSAFLALVALALVVASCTAEPAPGSGVRHNNNNTAGSAGSVSTGGAAGTGGASQCAVGTAPCGGACVNLISDPLNCGVCGAACGATQTCTNGACSCPIGSIACGGTCVNPASDVTNCGNCGVVCGAGQSCTNSACTCPPGYMNCGAGCVNLQADGMNCGACGTVCGVATPFCSVGACVASCPIGQVQCGTGCVDPASFQADPLNCGACGTQCAAGQSCNAGSCGCPQGQTDCAGVCKDLATDIANCGACNNPCSQGTTCSSSMCGCASGALCGNTCVNTQTDQSHCGMCNNACPTGQTCMTGTCSGGSRPANCPAAATLLSDFEEGTAVLVEQGGRNGWWYVYADPAAGSQSPASSTMAVAAALLNPQEGECNRYAMHSTASGHPEYVGFGATLSPGATPAQKAPVSLASYTGVSFRIKSGSGNAPPIWFELLNRETQPADLSGTAINDGIDMYNTRGRLIEGINTTWKTVFVPFGTLAPRYLPGGCATTAFCEAPGFNAASTLGFQYSLYSQFNASGAYDLWVDDVNLTTGDTGLPTHTQTAGAAHPFPRDATLGNGCVKPAGASGKHIIEAYQRWKATFVVAGNPGQRVQRPEANNDSVSEGIAYGMLIAVYMNDKPLFDGLWQYWNSKIATGKLMHWQINSGGGVQGSGSATDADEDAAFALIQASRQWSGGNYASEATATIASILASDVTAGNILKPGSNFGGPDLTNPSYFAPAFYRIFADFTGEGRWDTVATNTLNYLNSIEGSNGLVPAWCSNNCTGRGGGGYADNDKYQYDSHRTPWRMALDVCWNNNGDAKDYVNKTTNFFAGLLATGFGSFGDLYNADGSKCTGCSQMPKANSMSLIGTAATGAMASNNGQRQVFVDRAWRFLLDANYTSDPTFRTGSTSAYTYYNATVGLLAALTLSGNFNNF